MCGQSRDNSRRDLMNVCTAGRQVFAGHRENLICSNSVADLGEGQRDPRAGCFL